MGAALREDKYSEAAVRIDLGPSRIARAAIVAMSGATLALIACTPGPVGRTEDPVRLYLREMGRVSLLTREGEITLAKRIEEGKDESTRAILSTTLALDKIRAVRDDLRKDLVPIKDLVDYPEEEFTEEKEADLRRSVMRELGTVDRLLREREKVLDLARKLRKQKSRSTALSASKTVRRLATI